MRSRPLVFLAPVFAVALFVCVKLQISPSVQGCLLTIGALLAVLAFTLARPRISTAVLLLIIAASGPLYLAIYDLFAVSPVRDLAGQTKEISATLAADAVVYDDSQRAELIIDSERRFRTLCYLPLTDEPLLAGDRVSVMAEFYLSGDSEGFDRAEYQAANGVFIAASFVEKDESEGGGPLGFSYKRQEGSAPWLFPQRVAHSVQGIVNELLPQREGGLLNALLLGDKSGVSEADYAAFRKAGLSHMIAVSGMHVGFLVAFCFLLLGRKWGTLVSVAVVLVFIPMAGATPSVVRAGIMYLVAAGAFLTKRQADSMNSLCLALALLLLANPYAIASLGLQLSFAAAAGLILLSGRMQRRLIRLIPRQLPRLLKSLLHVLCSALSCTVCATIFTVPLLLSAFGYVSVLSIVSNILVIGVVSACFIGGLLLCLLFPLAPAISQIIAVALRPLLGYMLSVANHVAALPFGLVYWGDRFGLAALCVFCAAVLIWLFWGDKLKLRFAAPVVCGILIILTALGAHDERTRYAVTYLPCGTGQAILISHGRQELTLIDGSGSGHRDAAALVQAWMDWHCYDEIDSLILTAVDKGHARSLPELLDTVSVGKIYIPQGCKRTAHNGPLLDTLFSTDIPVIEVTEEQQPSDVLPIALRPVTNGKLAVRIGKGTAVLHSPTQKQLASYLAEHELQAQTVVLSQANFGDIDLLREALGKTGAKRIILQAGGETLSQFDGIPIESPYKKGEIVRSYPLKE